MMTVDNHVDVLRRLYESVWNGDEPDVADELVHADYYIHDRDVAERTRGPDLYRMLAERTQKIFLDMEFHIHETVSEGNLVALRWAMTGTHDGPMLGLKPTGTEVELAAIEINRFEAVVVEKVSQRAARVLRESTASLAGEEYCSGCATARALPVAGRERAVVLARPDRIRHVEHCALEGEKFPTGRSGTRDPATAPSG